MKNKIAPITLSLLVILSGLLVGDLFLHQGTFTAHDIETNIIYFGAFYDSLVEGNIIPRWSANLANLYGSPTSMFFYPFSYYLASLIKVFGFSLIDTMKIYIFITFILSAIFMYVWLKNHLTTVAAFIGSLLYVYAPYRINDIYARGSVAENTAFVFLPLAAHFIYRLRQKNDLRSSILLTLVFSALILSHPFMLIVFLPFYVSYLIFLKFNLKKLILLAISGIFSILLTSFYVIPLLLENKYTHYDISPFNGSGYFKQFLDFQRLFLPIWTFIDIKGKLEYQTYQIGILQLSLFIFCIFALMFIIRSKKINTKQKQFIIIGFLNFVLSIFLMLPISDFIYKKFPFLQRIEFPWRYLSLNLFSLSVLVSGSILLLRNHLQKLFVLVVIIIAILLYLPHARGHDYKTVADNYYLYDIKKID